MNLTPVDPNLFRIMKILDRYGHEKLPLKIIKEKQSYIVGHERDVPLFDGSGEHRKIFEHACKATFVKSTGEWQLYNPYDSLDAAMLEVRNDPNGCFWG
jgi:hypothetical protein